MSNDSIIDYSCLSPQDLEQEMKHEAMCAEMNEVVAVQLLKHYPGHMWGINSDIRQGIINIYLRYSTGNNVFGVTVKLDASMQVVLKNCVRFGGELLERYGLSAGKLVESEMDTMLANRNMFGHVKVDEG